jgi:hypothetical protein
MRNSNALLLGFLLSSAYAQTVVNITIQAAVPTGSIIAFNGACPTGWSEFSAGKGRVLLGAGSGNNDALGAPLTSRSIASVGGLEYTTGIPANNAVGADESVATPTGVIADIGSDSFTSAAPNTTLSGDKANSNMPPFVVVRYCEKN